MNVKFSSPKPFRAPPSEPVWLSPAVDAAALDQLVALSPQSVRVQLAREAARCQHLPMLEALERQGCFQLDPKRELFADDADGVHRGGRGRLPGVDTLFADEEIPILAALANVVNGAVLAKDDEGKDIANISGLRGRQLQASPEFIAFFERQVQALLDGVKPAWEAYARSIGANTQAQWDAALEMKRMFGTTLSVLAAAACAMDLPHTLAKLANSEHWTAEAKLRPTILGHSAFQTWTFTFHGDGPSEASVRRSCNVLFKPGVLAIEFGSMKCLRYLCERGDHEFSPVCHAGDIYESPDSPGPGATAAELMAAGLFGTTCEALRLIIESTPDLEADDAARHSDALLHVFERIMARQEHADMALMMVETGVCGRALWRCARAAFNETDLSVFRALEPELDWTEINTPEYGEPVSLLRHLIDGGWSLDPGGLEDQALAEAATLAHARGGFAADAASKSTTPAHRCADYAAFRQACFRDRPATVMRMLELGHDPLRPTSNGVTILQELDMPTDNDGRAHIQARMAALIRSWLARQAALDALSFQPGDRHPPQAAAATP